MCLWTVHSQSGHLYLLRLREHCGKRGWACKGQRVGKNQENCLLKKTESWHSWAHSGHGYQSKTCTGLSQSMLQPEHQLSAKKLLKVNDCGKMQGQLLVTAWPLSVSDARVDGLTTMYIWKALTGLRGSFFKRPRKLWKGRKIKGGYRWTLEARL